MKIDATENPRQLSNRMAGVPQQKQHDFSAVFEETVQKTGGIQSGNVHSIQSGAETTMDWAMPPNLMCMPDAAAHQLLGALEHYQHMLGDPAATLRTIQPLVEQMQKQAADIEPLFDKLSDDHPVKSIIQAAKMHISQEIEKFNSGHYVDRD